MEIGIICPIAWLERFAERSHYHLVLAHLVERGGKYVDFYRKMAKRGDFLTLDNSSFEVGDGKYSPADLIKLARSVGAREVMAPECFPDATKCIELSGAFISDFKENPFSEGLGVIATAHGRSYRELRACVLSYLKNDGINTVGLSCRLNFEFPYSGKLKIEWNRSMSKAMCRANSIAQLSHEINATGKQVHLLGLNHPMELLFYRNRKDFRFIRSNDSSAAYLNGRRRIFLDRLLYEKPEEKMNFVKVEKLDELQVEYIDANIIFWKDIAR